MKSSINSTIMPASLSTQAAKYQVP